MASRTASETPTVRRSGARRPLALVAGSVAALLAGLAFAAGPAAPTRPSAPPPTLGDCQNLLRQFDVAFPAHRDSAKAASAQQSRDLGEADCRDGKYVDGVYKLRRALHDIGVKPVKSVSPAPAH